MSNQPPYEPSRPPVPPSGGASGIPLPPDQPFEYIPVGAPQPMPRPAYLYAPIHMPVAPAAPGKWPGQGLVLAGFLLGLASVVLWIIPCLGDAVAMLGIALSILGWRSHKRKWMAMVGVALCAAAITAGLCNSALGGYIFPR